MKSKTKRTIEVTHIDGRTKVKATWFATSPNEVEYSYQGMVYTKNLTENELEKLKL